MTESLKIKSNKHLYYQKYYQKNVLKYKQYYQNNIDKFKIRNQNRPSQRNNYVGIEINGITYCFPSKAKINFKKVHKNDLESSNFKLIIT